MQVFVDDGSTNIKLAWKAKGEVKTLLSPNSFKPEWSMRLGVPGTDAVLAENYEIDGEKYSFDQLSPDAVRTTETRYQYSDVNVVAIHHALMQSGIEPQPVDIVVTLPLGEYLDEHNQPNMVNIERKKANVKRAVNVQGRDSFTVRKVSVLPESVPAGFDVLKELNELDSLLIVDIGGTTLDISHVRSKMSGFTKTFCDPKTGVSLITEGVKHAMDTSVSTRTSSYVADRMIQARNDSAFLTNYLRNAEQRNQILQVMQERVKTLTHRVVDSVQRFSGFTHVMVVGGGANIVSEAVKIATGVSEERFFVSDNPQFDLVLGMMAMKG
ncbi:plasmid segregation protein ParM [Serratia ureilytica]|uniref:plasmid segregation protein ParM n=1 Tax=Serratia ureilytica TaxID=300181 RepID=UPI001AA0FD51|nr:plasmid segregation protein ParM [Serratia ureilytica]MBO1811615.1 plasmid segregation protein ParM [Serratia ureilytica]